ncbi:MAG: peptide ABC transporter substrate-binding protein [Pseudomonadota bacterium]
MPSFRPIGLFMGAFLMAGALAGCDRAPRQAAEEGPSEAAAPARKIITIANGAEPSSLDPQRTNLVADRRVVGSLFAGLVEVDGAGNLIPGIAQSWDVSEDGKVYVFTLRQARWSDGAPITAQDFVFSFRRLLAPATQSPFAAYYFVLRNGKAVHDGTMLPDSLGVEALSAHILRLTLEQPMPALMGLLSHQSALPVPRHVVGRFGAAWTELRHLVVSGPFRLVEWQAGVRLELARNPLFYDADSLALDGVVFLPGEDMALTLRAFDEGEVDIVEGLPADSVARYRRARGEAVRIEPYWALYWYVFNTARPPFDDVRVRRALAMAVDRQHIVEQALGAGGVPATGIVPPSMPSYGPPMAPAWAELSLAARRAEAKRLLEDAGYGSGHALSVTISYNPSPDHDRVFAAVAADWRALGVTVSAHVASFREHVQALEAGDFEVARRTWVTSFDMPEYFLGLFVSSAGSLNVGRYANPAVDALYAQALETADLATRTRLLKAAEAILLDDAVAVTIYNDVNRTLVGPRVIGWTNNPTGRHPLRFLDLAPGQD